MEGRILIGDVSVDLLPRIGAVLGVDRAGGAAATAAEELPIGTGGGSVAPDLGERQRGLGIDDAGKGGGVGLLGEVPGLRPGELGIGHALTAVGHALQAEVGPVGQHRGQQGLWIGVGLARAQLGEPVGETGALRHL